MSVKPIANIKDIFNIHGLAVVNEKTTDKTAIKSLFAFMFVDEGFAVYIESRAEDGTITRPVHYLPKGSVILATVQYEPTAQEYRVINITQVIERVTFETQFTVIGENVDNYPEPKTDSEQINQTVNEHSNVEENNSTAPVDNATEIVDNINSNSN